MRILALILLSATLFAAGGRDIPELTREVFMQKAAERFDRMDTNSNGVVSREERQVARRQHMERRHERREGRQERRD